MSHKMFNNKDENQKESSIEENNLETIEKENEKLFLQLTNKNQDYFVQLDRRLDKLTFDPKQKTIILNQMFLETIDFQEDAITARRRYGTVTEQVDKIMGLDPQFLEGEVEDSPTWMIYMDGALLLGGMFSIINGFGAWRSLTTGSATSLSLVQLIMNFALGGLVALALNKYKPKPGTTEGMLKYTAVTIVSIFSFVLLMGLAQFLVPSVINPQLPPLMVMAIGVIGLLLKWYLKKELNIKGTLF